MGKKNKVVRPDGEWYLLKKHLLAIYVNVGGLPEHVGTFSTSALAQRACDDHNRTGVYVELPDSPTVVRVVMDYDFADKPAIVVKTVSPPRFSDDYLCGLVLQAEKREYRVTEQYTGKAAPGQLRSILRHKDAPKPNEWDAGW